MKSSLLRNTLFIGAVGILALGCGSSKQTLGGIEPISAPAPLMYTVNLNDRADDTFKVTLAVDDLGPDNAIYQFASTAPGTYQVMDIGRYVRSFEAQDALGEAIPSERISTNQWRISEPERVTDIRYVLAETWDTPVDENPIYLMAGTSIEDDHVLINGQGVFGYPAGMQARPLRIQLAYPSSWRVGTALDTDEAGYYLADDYDHVVDSPILLGRLSTASLDVRGTAVEVFTYSKTDKVQSEQILDAVTDILHAAGEFLVELPVDRYAFLFHFEDVSMGAWEHSYSSEYVFAEAQFGPAALSGIRSIVAHEFFHIVTPLNIHSEIIEYFNFVEPVASEHIWLYEGTTEWVAHAMQLRSGLITLDEYLARLSGKMNADDQYDKDYSLSRLSFESYSAKGQQEWGNIYQRGALVAGLLDLRLLELSGGTRGLREVIIDLARSYGPDTSFVENAFFDEFAERTYPEIRPFFDDYVRDTKPLPIAEYYAKVGIEYVPEVNTGEQVERIGLQVGVSGEMIQITGVSDAIAHCGMAPGDVILRINELDVSLQTAQQAFNDLQRRDVGDPYTMKVRRGAEEHELTCAKVRVERIDRHVFRVDPNATAQQRALREAWMKNL
ncbi:MAG: peptidase [Rhodothermales bacterium]